MPPAVEGHRPTYSHDEAVAAITAFYTTVERAHQISGCPKLLHPPRTGWSDSIVLGRHCSLIGGDCRPTDEAVRLLRHIPYFPHPTKHEILPGVQPVSYIDGEHHHPQLVGSRRTARTADAVASGGGQDPGPRRDGCKNDDTATDNDDDKSRQADEEESRRSSLVRLGRASNRAEFGDELWLDTEVAGGVVILGNTHGWGIIKITPTPTPTTTSTTTSTTTTTTTTMTDSRHSPDVPSECGATAATSLVVDRQAWEEHLGPDFEGDCYHGIADFFAAARRRLLDLEWLPGMDDGDEGGIFRAVRGDSFFATLGFEDRRRVMRENGWPGGGGGHDDGDDDGWNPGGVRAEIARIAAASSSESDTDTSEELREGKGGERGSDGDEGSVDGN